MGMAAKSARNSTYVVDVALAEKHANVGVLFRHGEEAAAVAASSDGPKRKGPCARRLHEARNADPHTARALRIVPVDDLAEVERCVPRIIRIEFLQPRFSYLESRPRWSRYSTFVASVSRSTRSIGCSLAWSALAALARFWVPFEG